MYIVEDDDIRLDRYLRSILVCPYSKKQSFIEKSLRKKNVLVDGLPAKASKRLHKGQKIIFKINIETISQGYKTHNNFDSLNVLYNENNFIIINKPCGLPTQGGTKILDSVDSLAPSLLITHRIDKHVSGALLLAKNKNAARLICSNFADRKIHKCYIAILCGIPSQSRGQIKINIEKQRIAGEEKMVRGGDKEAITNFEIIQSSIKHNLSLAKLFPLTGRKHQLRAHLSLIGHPIFGDKKYGAKHPIPHNYPKHSIALHSWYIKLENYEFFFAPIGPNISCINCMDTTELHT